MKPLGKTFGLAFRNDSTSEPRIPSARLALLYRAQRRRLVDDIEDVFKKACMTNDLEAAGDLLALLEKWEARRAERPGWDRRDRSSFPRRVRQELERRIALHTAKAYSIARRLG